jgi:hypothetical protein
MGEVLRKLAETTLPPRDDHNKRLFVDLSESVHIHFREHRLVFGVAEFRHFAAVVAEGMARLEQEVAAGYRSKSDDECRANVQVSTQIIGGSQRDAIPIPEPGRSKYFDERLVIEQQTPSVKDRFHVHYRDLRLVFNNDRTFLAVCDTFAQAAASYRAILPIGEITPRWTKTQVGALDHVDGGVPILVDNAGIIIDGHHRYYDALEKGADTLTAIRLGITFADSHPIRQFDLALKAERQWDLLGQYKRLLAHCLLHPRDHVVSLARVPAEMTGP